MWDHSSRRIELEEIHITSCCSVTAECLLHISTFCQKLQVVGYGIFSNQMFAHSLTSVLLDHAMKLPVLKSISLEGRYKEINDEITEGTDLAVVCKALEVCNTLTYVRIRPYFYPQHNFSDIRNTFQKVGFTCKVRCDAQVKLGHYDFRIGCAPRLPELYPP